LLSREGRRICVERTALANKHQLDYLVGGFERLAVHGVEMQCGDVSCHTGGDLRAAIPAKPVGAVVARGEAEIGLQQISELKPITGINLVGPLPPEVQQYTVFSAGLVVGAKEPEAGKALIRSPPSPAAASAIADSGIEPLAAP
jgi:hypothetical protein